MSYLNRKFLRSGFTLIELLITIMLVALISSILVKSVFPKEEDLRRKGIKEAIENMIQFARKIANHTGEEVRIHFIDHSAAIFSSCTSEVISSDNICYFDKNETNPHRQQSIENFLKIITTKPKSNPLTISWSSLSARYTTQTPFFIVTDKSKKIVFDDHNVCYEIFINPDQRSELSNLTMESKVFFPGYIKMQDYSWQRAGNARSYLTVYPNGLCDSVSFQLTGGIEVGRKGVPPAEFNRNFIVEPISGSVIDSKSRSPGDNPIEKFFKPNQEQES